MSYRHFLLLGASAGFLVMEDYLFSQRVLNINGGEGVDVVLDPVGANYLRDNIQVLQHDGRFVSYGLLSGGIIPEELNNNDSSPFLKQLLFKRISFLASTLRARSTDYKFDLIKTLVTDEQAGYPAVNNGRIKVNISKVFPIQDVVLAHEMMKRNENIGKIILQVISNNSPQYSEL